MDEHMSIHQILNTDDASPRRDARGYFDGGSGGATAAAGTPPLVLPQPSAHMHTLHPLPPPILAPECSRTSRHAMCTRKSWNVLLIRVCGCVCVCVQGRSWSTGC